MNKRVKESFEAPTTRGYFGVGVENMSKEHNAGALYRTAHAFGADFVFAFGEGLRKGLLEQVDTSKVGRHVPFYRYRCFEEMVLPEGCAVVGVELCDESRDLTEFLHPKRAIYVFGPERGDLSQGVRESCRAVLRIPTRFCVNVGIAAAIVMYDRRLCLGGGGERVGLGGK